MYFIWITVVGMMTKGHILKCLMWDWDIIDMYPGWCRSGAISITMFKLYELIAGDAVR